MAIGGSFSLNDQKSQNSSDSLFSNLHFLLDYWLGAYIQNIDSAVYVGLRTDIDTIDVGAMWDYHFTNAVGFSIGGGAELLGDSVYNTVTRKMEHEITPYARVGAFLHLITAMKLGLDYTYKFNGQQSIGLYVSFNSASLFTRLTSYQPVRRTSNRDLVGRWFAGDTDNGIEFYFGENFAMKAIEYENGRASTLMEGTWATTDKGGLFGVQLAFINITGLATTQMGYEVDPANGTLRMSIEGEEFTLDRYRE